MKFYASEYEEALIALLRKEGWDYTLDSELHRHNEELVLTEDLSSFLQSQHSELETNDVTNMIDCIEEAKGIAREARKRLTALCPAPVRHAIAA